MKYRYIMSGSFEPQNKSFLREGCPLHQIDIPCPFERLTYNEALADEHLTYRFGYLKGKVGILVMPRNTWNVVSFLDYAKFKKLGGIIYNVPQEAFCSVNPLISKENYEKFIKWVESEKSSWEPKDYEIFATFSDLFPVLSQEAPFFYIYKEGTCIDNEAYRVAEVK